MKSNNAMYYSTNISSAGVAGSSSSTTTTDLLNDASFVVGECNNNDNINTSSSSTNMIVLVQETTRNGIVGDNKEKEQCLQQLLNIRTKPSTSSTKMRQFSTKFGIGLLLVIGVLTLGCSLMGSLFDETFLTFLDSNDEKEAAAATTTTTATATATTGTGSRNSQRILHRGNKMDYSEYSCDHLNLYISGGTSSSSSNQNSDTSTGNKVSVKYHKPHINRTKQCAYAKTCNDGDGIYAPFVYCNYKYTTRIWKCIITPFVIIWLIILFRMVGSTAEDFFSPSLEMMSINLGLPPRFAGVTLLALGNGAPDIASTVNAILGDVRRGYLMGLGELAGAGMFISTIITGIVILYHQDPMNNNCNQDNNDDNDNNTSNTMKTHSEDKSDNNNNNNKDNDDNNNDEEQQAMSNKDNTTKKKTTAKITSTKTGKQPGQKQQFSNNKTINNDVPCNGSLIRDVIMFVITLIAVYVEFEYHGNVTNHTIRLMLGLYMTYVFVVFTSDFYHLLIVVPRRKLLKKQREEILCDCGAIERSISSSSVLLDESTTHEQYFSTRMILQSNNNQDEEDKEKHIENTGDLLQIVDKDKYDNAQERATETTSLLLAPTTPIRNRTVITTSSNSRPATLTRKHSSTCSSKSLIDVDDFNGSTSTFPSALPPKRSASGAIEYAIEAISNYDVNTTNNTDNNKGWGTVVHHHHHHAHHAHDEEKEERAVSNSADAAPAATAAAASKPEGQEEEEEDISLSSEEEMLVVYHSHYHGGVQKLPLKNKQQHHHKCNNKRSSYSQKNLEDSDEFIEDNNIHLPHVKVQSSGLLGASAASISSSSNPQIDIEDKPISTLSPLIEEEQQYPNLRARSQEDDIATSNYGFFGADASGITSDNDNDTKCTKKEKWFQPLKELCKLPCWKEQYNELFSYLNEQIIVAIYHNQEINIIEKIILTLELPFILLRMFTIPIPCYGYYCRPLVGISTMLSPLWIIYYLYQQFDINLLTQVSELLVYDNNSMSSSSSYYYSGDSITNTVGVASMYDDDDDDLLRSTDLDGPVEMTSKSALYDQHRATTDNEAYIRHIATVVMLCLPIIAGLFVLLLAPPSKYATTNGGTKKKNVSDDIQLPCTMTVPLGLYGFAIAATWIDAVADQLVDVLSFLGIIAHIPGPLMGLTVLAVGNSFGDLAANVTMARKGLSNMAITACFAGPVFNMLVGIALGFTLLGHSINNNNSSSINISVHLTNPLRAAFLFSLLNCILLIISGMILPPKGTIGRGYGYAALALYVIYTAISLAV